jgi:hypothetical protein
MLVALAGFGAGVGALPTRHRPIRTVTLAVDYFVNGTYTNSSDGGHFIPPSYPCGSASGCEGCEAGNENASFALRVGYARIKFRLASGSVAFAQGSDLGTGQWSEVGTEWNTSQAGNPCSFPGATRPLQCSGQVSTGVTTVRPGGDLTVSVHKRVVYLMGARLRIGEVNASTCGTPGWAIPFLGLSETLVPWNVVRAVIPLATLAAQHHDSILHLPFETGSRDSGGNFVAGGKFKGWDPSTCDGRNGSPGNIRCSGTLSIASSGLIVRWARCSS